MTLIALRLLVKKFFLENGDVWKEFENTKKMSLISAS
jgi:hypothetical protein